MNNIYISDKKDSLIFFNYVKNIKKLIIEELNLIINYIFNKIRI